MRELIIAGSIDSPEFIAIEATITCYSNQKNDLKFQLQAMTPEKFKIFLRETDKKYNLHLEISTKVIGYIIRPCFEFIGTAQEVFEYMDKMYGFKNVLTKSQAESFIPERIVMHKKFRKFNKKKDFLKKKGDIKVALWGAGCLDREAALLIQFAFEGLRVGPLILYERHPDSKHKLHQLKNDLIYDSRLVIADNLNDVLKDTDLLIVLGDVSQSDENESLVKKEKISEEEMIFLGKEIQIKAQSYLKIILTCMPQSCKMATVLAGQATKIPKGNFIAITSQYGLMPLNYVSEVLQLKIYEEISCPPVWGLPGQYHFIDVLKSRLYLEKQGVIHEKGKKYYPIPNGDILPETVDELASSIQNHYFYVSQHKEKLNGERPFVAEVEATRTAIQLWFNISFFPREACFGIYSNGEWGFPSGHFVSQPAKKNDNDSWEANISMPFPNDPFMSLSRFGKLIKMSVEDDVRPILSDYATLKSPPEKDKHQMKKGVFEKIKMLRSTPEPEGKCEVEWDQSKIKAKLRLLDKLQEMAKDFKKYQNELKKIRGNNQLRAGKRESSNLYLPQRDSLKMDDSLQSTKKPLLPPSLDTTKNSHSLLIEGKPKITEINVNVMSSRVLDVTKQPNEILTHEETSPQLQPVIATTSNVKKVQENKYDRGDFVEDESIECFVKKHRQKCPVFDPPKRSPRFQSENFFLEMYTKYCRGFREESRRWAEEGCKVVLEKELNSLNLDVGFIKEVFRNKGRKRDLMFIELLDRMDKKKYDLFKEKTTREIHLCKSIRYLRSPRPKNNTLKVAKRKKKVSKKKA